jgi:hypothetical protein
VEYINTNGEFTRQSIKLKEAEFFVRFPYSEKGSIVVAEFINGHRIQEAIFQN